METRFPRAPLALSALLTLTLASPDAHAQSSVAVVDVQTALMQTEDGQKAQRTLKSQFDSLQKDLDSTQAELARAKDDIEKQQRVLSNEALRRRIEDWQRRMVDLQTKFVEHNKSLQKRQNELTGPILKRLVDTIGRVAKREGYEVVIDRTAAPYARADLDLTDRVVQLYNQGEGGDTPAAPKR